MSDSIPGTLVNSAGNDGEALFLHYQSQIRKTVGHLSNRYRLSLEDREDLLSLVNLKLIDDDYKILHQFEGRCKLESYLFLIINRIYWEWRHKTEGRWRPSVHAERLGKAAVQLETLIYRDGYQYSEASKVMEIHHGLTSTESEKLMQQLPVRQRRHMVSGTNLDELASIGENHEAIIFQKDRQQLGIQLQKALNHAFEKLSSEDQLILKLHFHDNLKIVDIARSLNHPAKRLYKRMKRLLNLLSKDLKKAGFGKKNQEELFEAIRTTAFLSDADSQASREMPREGS